jgi:hypothetical protein
MFYQMSDIGCSVHLACAGALVLQLLLGAQAQAQVPGAALQGSHPATAVSHMPAQIRGDAHLHDIFFSAYPDSVQLLSRFCPAA